jgi:hypothetical protein
MKKYNDIEEGHHPPVVNVFGDTEEDEYRTVHLPAHTHYDAEFSPHDIPKPRWSRESLFEQVSKKFCVGVTAGLGCIAVSVIALYITTVITSGKTTIEVIVEHECEMKPAVEPTETPLIPQEMLPVPVVELQPPVEEEIPMPMNPPPPFNSLPATNPIFLPRPPIRRRRP